MSWITYPKAQVRDQGHYQPRWAAHQAVILHTMVGYLESTDAMFAHDSSFSHFGVGGKWGGDPAQNLDGKVYQWQDLRYSAEANVEGNPYTFSIETADNAPQYPSQIEPWTPAQLDGIVDLVAWLCRTFDIPAVKLPDTRPGSRGIGWHEMGTHAHLVNGGLYYGDHECPGPVREHQVTDVVIPRVQTLLKSGAHVPPAGGSPAARIIPLHVVVTQSMHAKQGTPQKPCNPGLYLNDALRAAGFRAPASHVITKQTVLAVQDLQRHLGFSGADADGILGSASGHALLAMPKVAAKDYILTS